MTDEFSVDEGDEWVFEAEDDMALDEFIQDAIENDDDSKEGQT